LNCGFGPKLQAPFDIEPRSVFELECHLTFGDPGPFGHQIHLFVDDDGVREFVLKVHGEIQGGEAAEIKP
jgi:hypothetical protein